MAEMDADVLIRAYQDQDERGWVVCRVLSFLDSAFYDDVRQAKEHYERHAIELVADRGGEIVGLIDVECEELPGTVCEERPGLGGMIWHLAVHPDHQRQGVASILLREAERLAKARGLARFEAWTRDDPGSRAWYEARGFELVDSYLHVYVELDEGLRDLFPITSDQLRPVKVFAHYVGDDGDAMRGRFSRVHDDVLYELHF
jgi:ribosomal protein S18 acetylase RimI-like enzyme